MRQRQPYQHSLQTPSITPRSQPRARWMSCTYMPSYYNMCPHTARLIAYCCHSFKAAKLAYNEGPGRRVNSCTHFVPSALTLGCKSTRNLQAGKRSLMHSRTRRCRNRCRCSSGSEGDVMQSIIIALHYNTHPLVSPLIACLTKSHASSR